MSLSKIKNKLYSREADVDISQHSRNEFDIQQALKEEQVTAGKEEDVWDRKNEELKPEN